MAKSDPQPLSGREPGNGYSLVPTDRNGHGVILAISGEIDIANVQAFTDEVHSLLDGAFGPVTLDLKDCSFIDSAAIRALMILAKEQGARGRTLRLSGVTGEPLRVLKVAGLVDSRLFATN